MYPLNFKEYMSAYSGTVQAGFNEYMLYGGLPQTEQIGQYVPKRKEVSHILRYGQGLY